VDGDDGEAHLLQHQGEGARPRHRLDKDDHLVELELIDQVGQLAVLLGLLDRHIVLLQAVQRQLGLVVHQNLVRLTEPRPHNRRNPIAAISAAHSHRHANAGPARCA
jgi:hypothetical protein